MGFLDGRAALVTGGSSGIGLATVRRLQEEGAEVVVVDLQPPQADVRAFIEADVGDAAAWPVIVERAVQAAGGIDVAHLNAGVTTGESRIEHITDEQYERIRRVNQDQVFFGTRALVAHMKERGGGSIVATASLAGLTAVPIDPVYAATKHAVVGLVRSLGPQLEPLGIKINAVCPGFTDTPLLGDAGSTAFRDAGFPLLEATDIAAAVIEALSGGGTGLCYFVQPGREPAPFRFSGIPGPRTPGKEGMPPPSTFSNPD